MALPLMIESIEGIDEATQKLYIEREGKFHLDVTGLPEIPGDYDEVKASLAKLEENNQKLLKQKAEAKKAADAAVLEAAKTSGDVESIQKSYEEKISTLDLSWSEKHKALEDAMMSKEAEYNGIINNLTVKSTARTIAASIAKPGTEEVFIPHIEARLSVEIKSGEPITKVLDKAGKLSAMTVDELKEEFKNNASFAELVVGTKANGSGSSEGGAGNSSNIMTRSEFNKLQPAEQSEFIVKNSGKITDD